MKIELDRLEVQEAVAQYIHAKFGGEWLSLTADYSWPRSVEFTQRTPEFLKKAADELEAAKRIAAQWERDNPPPRPSYDAQQAIPMNSAEAV